MSLSAWLQGDSPKPGTKRKIEESEKSESPAKKKFTKSMNQASFNWYIQDENELWHCKICRQAKFDTPYAKGHKTAAKTTNHTRHATSQQHLDAVQRSTLQAEKPMQTLLAKKISRDDEFGINLLKTAYHIAKRELPKDEMKHMVSYATSLGVHFNKSGSYLSYTTNQSVSELQSALASIVLEDKISEVKKSGVYALTIDESTDRGNVKRVLMYAQYATDVGLKYCLLSNKKISEGSACAQNIVNMVVSELKDKSLDIKNMVGIGTDGANVMTGRKGGVIKLLQDHNPALIGVHCAAHRTALATSQAAKLIPDMDRYSQTITNVFKYFKNSALRSNRLRAIQILLNIPTLKFAEVHSVRWLSLEHAVQVVYRTYPALVMTLEREAHYEAAAKGILNEVNQFKFIALTHLMMDILPFMTRLSKKFQTDTVDFSKVMPYVTSVCDSLQDLLEVPGVFVDKLDKFVVKEDDKVVYKRPVSESDCSNVVAAINENYAFPGFNDEESDEEEEEETETVGYSPELRYYTQQQSVIETIAPVYIENLTNNLKDRFQNSDLLECMDVINPTNISGASDLPKYGLNEMEMLGKHFEKYLPNKDELKSEYMIYKRFVKGNYPRSTVVEVLTNLLKCKSDFPNITELLKCCVVIPMTSVKCERGFSTQNRIKSKSRTSLKCKTLDDLMRIVEDGPEATEVDYERALTKWKADKVRKLYSM